MGFNILCLALGLISTAYGVPVANNVGLSHVDVTARNGNFPHVNYEFMNECQPRKIKLEKGLPEFKFPPHQPSLANVAVETVLAGFGTAGSALNDFVVWIWRTTKTILARRLILIHQTIIGTLISYERRFPDVEGEEAQKERKERIVKERIQKTKTICLEFVPSGASKNLENGIGGLNKKCPELD
ncbi:hypothetical protein EV368DRAFT_60654 [Lentinula lateritia]|nr:hypothetical protein EV368DRAFT_60654 [Lentinula lateritia]